MSGFTIHDDLRGCVDCLTISANGPGDSDAATVERVRAGLAGFGGSHAEFLADTDPETGGMVDTGFTWGPCQVCGLSLGHDYYRGSVIVTA